MGLLFFCSRINLLNTRTDLAAFSQVTWPPASCCLDLRGDCCKVFAWHDTVFDTDMVYHL